MGGTETAFLKNRVKNYTALIIGTFLIVYWPELYVYKAWGAKLR